MDLARWTRPQRRLKTFLNTPDADTLRRRAIDVKGVSDGLITQVRTSHTFISFQQNASVRERPRGCLSL
jgi:hypothetical protein